MNWKLLAIGIAGTVLGFLLQANGPLGAMIWPMADGLPEPEGANLALLMVIGGIEAAAFGAGIAFLVAAYPAVKRLMRGSTPWALAVYLSIAWTLVNWVPHTSLHMAHGNIVTPADFGGLVAIEYGFHLTLVLAGTSMALGVMRAARTDTPAAAATQPRTPTATKRTA